MGLLKRGCIIRNENVLIHFETSVVAVVAVVAVVYKAILVAIF